MTNTQATAPSAVPPTAGAVAGESAEGGILMADGQATMKTAEEVILDFEARIVALVTDAETIQATADAEGRAKTDEESAMQSKALDEVERLQMDVAGRKRLLAQRRELERPRSKTRQPDPVEHIDIRAVRPEIQARAEEIAANKPRQLITGGAAPGGTASRGGFSHFGLFAKAVADACESRFARVDSRLLISNAAPTTFGSEGIGPDGGFAVPPDFIIEIQRKVLAEDSLLPLVRRYEVKGNSLVFPVSEVTPWSTSGTRSFWGIEAGQLNQAKPEIQSRNLRLEKLYVFTPVTNELLEDASMMSQFLRDEMGAHLDYAINDALVAGDGTGKPQGFLNAGSKVTQATGTGQSSNTVVFQNITAMRNRMYSRWLPNAVWICNQDVLPQLQQMVVPAQGSGAAIFPAYMPANGLSEKPYDMLMGHRIILSEAASALGTEGDIIFVAPETYICGVKAGGPQFAINASLYFDADATAFRLTYRIAGESMYLNPITRKHGSNTLSNIITLSSTRN